MANVSRTIDVIFNGKDSITGPVKSITKGLKSFNTAIDNTIDKVDILADKFKLASEIAVGFGATIAALSVNEFARFESAWIDLAKITEGGFEAIQVADGAIKDLAYRFGTDIVSITRSTVDFKRAGVDLQGALALVENALNLASAGNTDMAVSTEFLIAVMKGFRIDATKMGHTVDILNVLSDKYATNVTELGVAMSRIAPIAKDANLSLEKTAAVALPMIEVFRSGEEAGTALRRGLSKLTDDAKPVVRTLTDLGIAQREGPNKSLRDGVDILTDLAVALQHVDKSNRTFILSQIFGQRQGAKLTQTFSDWAYVLEIEAEAAMVQSQYTIDQVNLKLASMQVSLGRTKVAVQDFAIELGRNLAPGAKDALEGVQAVVKSVADSIEAGLLDGIFDQFNKLGVELEIYFKEIATALPKALALVDYSGLTSSINRMLKSIGLSIGGLDLTKTEDLAKAIQFVIDAMESGIDVANGMLKTYLKVKDVIIEGVRAFNAYSAGQKEFAGKSLATADIMERLGKTIGFLVTQADAAPTILSDAMTSLGDAGAVVEKNYELFGLQMQRITADALLGVATLINNATGKSIGFINRAYEALHEEHKILVKDTQEAAEAQELAYIPWIKNMEELKQKLARAKKASEEFNNTIFETPESVEVGVVVRTDLSEIDVEIDRIRDEVTKKKAEEIRIIKDQVADAQAEIGVLGDAYLARYERDNTALRVLANARAEYEKTSKTIEIEPTKDDKFKAAQKKLLKEIDTNADIMEAKIKGFADIAKSESDAISASFDSISDSMNSTGDVLTALYDQMSDAGTNIFAQQAIQRKITEEEQRREEAFELQKQLTTAQIDLIKQRAAAMAAGDPIITVSGDGLQPHLEAFMWEILGAIKVRVNEKFGNMLLGIGAS